MPAPRDLHPLLIALLEAWARRWGWDPEDVWSWLGRTADPPEAFVSGAVDAFFPLVRREDFGALPSGTERAIDRHVSQASIARYRAVREPTGRPIVSEHPFPSALRDARVTVTEWAMVHKVSRSHVKSWFMEGDGGRPIPRKFAEAIRKEFAVPFSAWKHGIKD